jgi:transposase
MARPSLTRSGFRIASLKEEAEMADIAVLAIDLGKNSCSMAGLDAAGRVVLRRRVQRDPVPALLRRLQPCVVAMEACCGAHHLGRATEALGHPVRLMAAGVCAALCQGAEE